MYIYEGLDIFVPPKEFNFYLRLRLYIQSGLEGYEMFVAIHKAFINSSMHLPESILKVKKLFSNCIVNNDLTSYQNEGELEREEESGQ